MRYILLSAALCTTLARAAPPPDTLFQKVNGCRFEITSQVTEMDRHIDLEKGGWEGANTFQGNVQARIGSATVACDSAINDERGFVFLAPVIHINNTRLTAEHMIYYGKMNRAILENVLAYNDGMRHYDYGIIDFVPKEE